MINKNIDCLVLGCTHYNFLIDIIEEILPENIILIDTITPVIKHIKNTLISNEILNDSIPKDIYIYFIMIILYQKNIFRWIIY